MRFGIGSQLPRPNECPQPREMFAMAPAQEAEAFARAV